MKLARKPKKKPWGLQTLGSLRVKNKDNSSSKARIESKIQLDSFDMEVILYLVDFHDTHLNDICLFH